MKRILLFVVTNILVLTMLTIVMKVFGLESLLSEQGIQFLPLLIFSAVIGFGGAFISLAISKWMAKTFMGVKVINPRSAAAGEAKWLVDTTHRLAHEAGMKTMPEVGFWDSPEVNAFATGPSQKNSLVAVSTGLLRTMSPDEAEGVIAHEVAHIVNGDMVTMTLLQGIVNTFAIFLARVVAWVVSSFLREDLGWLAYFLMVMVFQVIFMVLGNMIVMAFSRYREFRADEGGARLAGKEKMVAALQRLQTTKELVDNRQPAFQSLKISSGQKLMLLFSSHPPLEKRIEALQNS